MLGFGLVLRLLGQVELGVAVFSFCVSIILVIAQVGARQIGMSLWWGQEWAQLLMMYAYFLGVSHLYQVRQMIVMGLVFSRLPRYWRKHFYVATQLAVILFCACVIVSAWKIMPMELRFPSFVIQVPRFYWTVPLMIASLSMILTSVYFIVAVIRHRAKDGETEIRDVERAVAFTRTTFEY